MLASLEPYLEGILWWGTGLSLLMLAATLIAAPWLVSRLPIDYFSRPQRNTLHSGSSFSFSAVLLAGIKNIFGLSLVLMGLLMLFTPGQGLLTLLIGLMLMNFPGKYRLEQFIVRQPGVFKAINWLRQRRGAPPLNSP